MVCPELGRVFVALIISSKRLILAWCIDISLVGLATGMFFTLALHFFAVIGEGDRFDQSLGAKK